MIVPQARAKVSPVTVFFAFVVRCCCDSILGARDGDGIVKSQSHQSVLEELQHLLDVLSGPGGDAGVQSTSAERPGERELSNVVARLQADPSGPAKGELAELHLLGLADGRSGSLQPPNGFPRSLSQAAMIAAGGAAAGGCGRCFFLVGALIEQGEPESSQSTRFTVREGGRVEFRWAPRVSGSQESGLDRPALAYYVGAELGDPLARLAFARYVFQGLTLGPTEGEWWQIDDSVHSGASRREPRSASGAEMELARCRRTLKLLSPVAEDAAYNEDHAMDSTSDLSFLVEEAWKVAQAKKEHVDWVAAHARDHRQADEVAYAAYHLHGDSDISFPRNQSRARQLFERVAAKGNPEAAWSALLLHARVGDLLGLQRNARKIMDDPNAPQVQKVVANHYVYRHGFNVERNATRAGAYLVLAADLGDANAQQTVAHGYAGLACPELDGVQVPGSPNERKAIHYYMAAARQGRPVSAVNAATLLVQQESNTHSLHTCRAAVDTFRNVALAYHPAVLRMHAHARRAFRLGDLSGALLRFQLLSEIGAKNAHENAAALWSHRAESSEHLHSLCWRASSPGNGHICEREYLHRIAAFSGTVDAMMRLSAAYASAEDDSAAFHWASRAASKGSSHALYMVAYRKHHGLGTSQNFSSACADYCQLWHRYDDTVLPRALALLQAVRLQLFVTESCCEFTGTRPYVIFGGVFVALMVPMTAAALYLR